MDATHTAACRCGQLSVTVTGAPVRVSVCHCLACQKRTGSAFAAQARWPEDRVAMAGASKTWVRRADSGNEATYHFCPECGSTVAYRNTGLFEGLVAVPVGAFDDPYFLSPRFSVWEERRHDWVAVLGEAVEHHR